MRLVYEDSGEEVQVGDTVHLDDEVVVVEYFSKPHKPASSGKVTVRTVDGDWSQEYYVSVIGAKWIEREDRRI